jgi:hypothetical protein
MMDFKRFSQLRIEDFEQDPVWTWADEDEGQIAPVVLEGEWDQDCDAVFVRCELVFTDKSRYQGVVGIRCQDRSVYVLSIPSREGSLITLPLQRELTSMFADAANALSVTWDRHIDQIFPINYETGPCFSDGSGVGGIVTMPGSGDRTSG